MVSRTVSWNEVYKRLSEAPAGRLYGIPRGGSIVAGLTGRAVDAIDEADWLVDDVIDTRTTAEDWISHVEKPVWALFDRERDGLGDRQLILPWEVAPSGNAQRAHLERIGLELIETLGYDPNSEGLRDTPRRWARWWQDFHAFEAGNQATSFEAASSGRLVTVSRIPIWSICEHHLLPFSLEVSIGYVPRQRLLGLSKFARIANAVAHRLQLQERLTNDIAQGVAERTGSPDVAVLVRGRHQCLEARGVGVPAVASTLAALGAFENDHVLRHDFLALVAPAPIADF